VSTPTIYVSGPGTSEQTLFVDTGSRMTASSAQDLLSYGCWTARTDGTYIGVRHENTDRALRAIRAALETLGVKASRDSGRRL
jgi:hypothetical protein